MKLYLHLVVIACICIFAVNCAPSERRKAVREDKKFKKQLRSLFKLGCRPSKCKVPIKTLLNSTSIIHDLELVYPQFVVVKKCKESCSFCKFEGDKNGIENSVCKAKRYKTKRVLVKYFDPDTKEWNYERVETKEDKKCKCMDKEDDWN